MPSAARSRSAARVTIAAFLPPISAMQGRGQRPAANWRTICMPTSCEPVNVMPAACGAATSAAPTMPPAPLTRFSTPSGRPASRSASISSQPDSAVLLATLNTTVLPATSAAPIGPPASAKGKLNGAMTIHAPQGLSTERLRLDQPGSGSSGRLRTKPSFASIWPQYQAMRSAVSCTSPRASMRFLPTSIATAAPMSYTRSSMIDAARRSSATRSRHGVAAQPGKAARAAASASSASSAVPLGKRPRSHSRSIGERTSKHCDAVRGAPPIHIGRSCPMCFIVRASAASKRSWSACGGSNIVE